ncbi:MAG TPA: energy transducer TonB [Gemmatimonadaceae bacterium]|nr:energy transducer TonB [Gemmatimonadaceae bacterium]
MFYSKLLSPGAVMLVWFSIGCAATKAASSACPPAPEELAQFGTVYRACAVDRKAAPPSTSQMMNYEPTQACGRVELDVVVDTAGQPIPESAKVVRSNDPGLLQAVLASLGSMHYIPARKDGQPVQQLVRIGQGYVVTVTPAALAGARRRPPRSGPPC